MTIEDQLRERLRKAEALHFGATSAGEREAASTPFESASIGSPMFRHRIVAGEKRVADRDRTNGALDDISVWLDASVVPSDKVSGNTISWSTRTQSRAADFRTYVIELRAP